MIGVIGGSLLQASNPSGETSIAASDRMDRFDPVDFANDIRHIVDFDIGTVLGALVLC